MQNARRINLERLAQEFIRLAEIPSPSFKERALANYLEHRLEQLGLIVEEDNTGDKIGGDCGNLFARLPGKKGLPALFFCAHMDTVEPAHGVKVVFRDGVFKSSGDTILGGDDKAGIAAILELLEILKETGKDHCPIEILFTVAEEQGLLGSQNYDFSRMKAKFGYVLDCSGEPGTMIIAAPAQNKINITVRGCAAHAGIEPEKGVNAIHVAAKALHKLKLGRIDEETTANIGIISGGRATNIVPDAVFLQGETRSLKKSKLDIVTNEIFQVFQQTTEQLGAKCEFRADFLYPEFHLNPELPVLKIGAEAARLAGLPVGYETSGGGSDANIINAEGFPAVNMSIGMQNVHTVEEFLLMKDLVSVTNWLWEIVDLITRGESYCWPGTKE